MSPFTIEQTFFPTIGDAFTYHPPGWSFVLFFLLSLVPSYLSCPTDFGRKVILAAAAATLFG